MLLNLQIAVMCIGLLGFTGCWLMELLEWTRSVSTQRKNSHLLRLLLRRLLPASLCFYTIGIGLGMLVSWGRWSAIWQWDAREMFAALTACIGFTWLLASQQEIAEPMSKRTSTRVSIATCCFGAIALLYVTAGSYSELQHSDRLPPSVPTGVVVATLIILATIGVLSRLQKGRLGMATVSQ